MGMRNVRVDTEGDLRCWHCGCTSFTEKRTFRAKFLVGVSSLLTKKKLKCKVCDEYNDVGNAQPYKGPASKRLGKKFGTFVAMHGADVDGDRIVASAYDQPIVAVMQQTPLLGWRRVDVACGERRPGQC